MFSSFLKQAREQAGLSQLEVSKKFKYSSPQFISNWERGMASPPIKAMYKLAKLYKIDENVLEAEFIKGKMDEKLRQIKDSFKSSAAKSKPTGKRNRSRIKRSPKVRGAD